MTEDRLADAVDSMEQSIDGLPAHVRTDVRTAYAKHLEQLAALASDYWRTSPAEPKGQDR
jgi:hypothetical protein